MLRATDYKENDKIVTLLTAERGKLTAVLRGVRKNGAKLKFAAQPFCFAEYVLAEKSGRNTVTAVTQADGFYELREDIVAFYAASAVCEVCDVIQPEGDGATDLFFLAIRALRDMCTGNVTGALVGFLWKALAVAGYALSCDVCANCGAELGEGDGEERKIFFDFPSGTFTCGACKKGAGVSPTTLYILRKADGTDCPGMETDDGKKRAIKLLSRYFTFRTEEPIHSLAELLTVL